MVVLDLLRHRHAAHEGHADDGKHALGTPVHKSLTRELNETGLLRIEIVARQIVFGASSPLYQ